MTEDQENQRNIELYLALMDRYKMLRVDPTKLREADEFFQAARDIYQYLDLTEDQVDELVNAVG
jgi:hypothetical protein